MNKMDDLTFPDAHFGFFDIINLLAMSIQKRKLISCINWYNGYVSVGARFVICSRR